MINDKLKKIYKISGMNCASCASLIELDLEDAGIPASCSYAKSTLEVNQNHDKDKVMQIVNKAGYKVEV